MPYPLHSSAQPCGRHPTRSHWSQPRTCEGGMVSAGTSAGWMVSCQSRTWRPFPCRCRCLSPNQNRSRSQSRTMKTKKKRRMSCRSQRKTLRQSFQTRSLLLPLLHHCCYQQSRTVKPGYKLVHQHALISSAGPREPRTILLRFRQEQRQLQREATAITVGRGARWRATQPKYLASRCSRLGSTGFLSDRPGQLVPSSIVSRSVHAHTLRVRTCCLRRPAKANTNPYHSKCRPLARTGSGSGSGMFYIRLRPSTAIGCGTKQ
jgi:hypothetical protein